MEVCKVDWKGSGHVGVTWTVQWSLTSILAATGATGGTASGCLYPRSLGSARPEFKSSSSLLSAIRPGATLRAFVSSSNQRNKENKCPLQRVLMRIK